MSRRQYRSDLPITAPNAVFGTKRGTSGETFVSPEEASPLSAEVRDRSIERRHHSHTTTIVAAPIRARRSAVSTRPSARSIGTANSAPSGVQATVSTTVGIQRPSCSKSISSMRCMDSEKP